MGFILSCCRRRKPSRDSEESQPLLRNNADRAAPCESRPSTYIFTKLGQVLGALKAGKYPSQAQINHAIQLLLSSELLNTESHGRSSSAELSDSGSRIVHCLRAVLERIAQFGLEKNGTLALL
jgi:hypothetical protein